MLIGDTGLETEVQTRVLRSRLRADGPRKVAKADTAPGGAVLRTYSAPCRDNRPPGHMRRLAFVRSTSLMGRFRCAGRRNRLP